MNRNFLSGIKGDLENTIFSACGYNLKKIYNKFKKAYKKKLSFLFFILFYDYIYNNTIKLKVNHQ